MCDRFPRKFDVQTSYKSGRKCCEHQTSSGNLSHDSAFDRITLLFNYIIDCAIVPRSFVGDTVHLITNTKVYK